MGFEEGVGPTVDDGNWDHALKALAKITDAGIAKRDQEIASLNTEIGGVLNRLQASHDMIERLRAMIDAMRSIATQVLEKNAGLP